DVIADRLLTDREALSDLRVAEPFFYQSQHLPLPRGERDERRVLAAGLVPKPRELQDRLAEAFPRRLLLEEDVVLRIEFDELGVRDPRGENVPLRNRGHVVVARVQHQRLRPDLAE